MDDDSCIESILAAWQEQLDEGRAPEPEAVIAAHPALEGELRGCFAALLAVRSGTARAPGLTLRTLPPNRYSVFRPVGEGGMGLVYRAVDNDLNREVAFKVIRSLEEPSRAAPDTPADIRPPPSDTPGSKAFDTVKQRFLQEAWVTGALAHPGIVPVYELGQTETGVPYYTMRFVRGERTLGDAIAACADAPVEERLHLLEPFLKVCDTIQYAHAQYVIHRDLKPQNIALGQFGEVVVLDWGLAKLKGHPGGTPDPWRERLRAWREAADLKTVSMALGTPGYMAPEAAAGQIDEIDEQSDVYSLGAILFRILTGRGVFTFDGFEDLAQQVTWTDAPAPRDLVPSIPAPLSDLCRSALARDKTDRPAGVHVLAEGIRRWQTRSQLDRDVHGWIQEARERLDDVARRGTAARFEELERALMLLGRVLDARPSHEEAGVLVERAHTLQKAGLEARGRAVRRRFLFKAGGVLLVVGTVAALLVATALERRRRDAETSLFQARTRGLVAASAEAERFDPMLSLWLARRAARRANPPAASTVSRLYAALMGSHERARFDGHSDQIRSGDFAPAGDAVVTAGRDGTARIWPLDGGAPLVLPHGEPLADAVFSSTGTHVLTRSEDGLVAWLWDRAGRQVAELRGHEGRLRVARFAPTGERILTASDDGTARLWDYAGVERAQLRGHEGPVHAALFSRDGEQILTGSEDGTVRLWARTGRELRTFTAPAAVWELSYAPDGDEILVSLADGTSRLWSADGEERARYRGTRARFSSAGDRIVAIVPWSQLCVHDRGGRLLATFAPPGGAASRFEFLPEEHRVAVACYDSTVRIWDPRGVQATAVLAGHAGWTEDIAFSPRGDTLLTASRDGSLRLWETVASAHVALRGHTARIDAALFSPTGRHALTAARDGTARLWDREGKQIAAVPYATASGVAFSPSGDRFVVGSADHVARIWDLSGHEVAALRGHDATIVSIAYTADGSEIVTASKDRSVRRWSAAGQSLAGLPGPRYAPKRALTSPRGDRILVTWVPPRQVQFVTGLGASLLDRNGRELAELGTKVRVAAFAPDGERIVTGSYDGVVAIWNADGRRLASFQGHAQSVLCCAFTPDGGSVLTGSDDATARLWDLEGHPLAVLRGHGNSVVRCAIGPRGRKILTGAYDQTARLWDITGRPLATLHHEGNLAALGFVPDGESVFTASFDGAARIWPLEVDALLAIADARLTRELTAEERARYVELLGEAVRAP
jgi:WD40 repeat protein/serine/threonine protein kinase